jgi:septin family protein
MAASQPHAYDIKRIEMKDPEYISEVPEHLRNQDIPGFPSTILLVGRPGSGKTNVLNLLLSKQFWYGFFDKIYLCGPTVKNDKLYQNIKVKEDQIVTNQEDFLP